jgi:hypothetical protein
MWWPAIIIGSVMLLTGLVFVLRRHALAQAYAARRTPLPRDHPQYRAIQPWAPGSSCWPASWASSAVWPASGLASSRVCFPAMPARCGGA